MSEFETSNIPSDKKAGWKLTAIELSVSGNETILRRLVLENERFGKLEYGLHPSGLYDVWAFHQAEGGGVLTVPFCHTSDGELLVGLILEKRPNMNEGKPVPCAIGGFVNPGESAEAAQEREAGEEAGIDAAKATELDGSPANCNRAFWVTQKGQGDKFWGLELPESHLIKKDGVWHLNPDTCLPDFKKPEDVAFFPWREAIKETPDGIAKAAIAQLLANIL